MSAVEPNPWCGNVRVASVRSRRLGGVIFSGYQVDERGNRIDSTRITVVKVPRAVLCGREVNQGECWQCYGDGKLTHQRFSGHTHTEFTIEAQDVLLLKPSGSLIIDTLAEGKQFSGIGHVKAQKLWDRFGEKLYALLDQRDTASLEAIISPDVAQALVDAWQAYGDSHTLRFLQQYAIPLKVARKVIQCHGKDVAEKLRDDPYRLLSFTASWKEVDALALAHFHLGFNDPRRRQAAIEEALYRLIKNQHTAATIDMLYDPVTKLLASHINSNNLSEEEQHEIRQLAQKAILDGKSNGSYLFNVDESSFHPVGAWLMERSIAAFVTERLSDYTGTASGSSDAQDDLFTIDLEARLGAFEKQEGQRSGIRDFALNEAQKQAVITSFSAPVSLITGGAGVGKTTVLKALYYLLDTTNLPRFQMALSGRAAKRMAEATNEKAITIASFLKNTTKEELTDAPIVLIDESSMLDIATTYRIIKKLPTQARLVLIGDPYQLPPIGAGLVFHLLCETNWVPKTELTEVKRQSSKSGIPLIASQVRKGIWHDLPSVGKNCRMIVCSDDAILPTTIRLYDESPETTQILAATNYCKWAGIKVVNAQCQNNYTANNQKLLLWSDEYDQIEDTGFRLNDLVIYTKNDWERGLLNGSLGRLIQIYDQPKTVTIDEIERTSIGLADFEDARHEIYIEDVDEMELGYAISVHKAQGSQFSRVVIPVRESRVLDRTWIYTAITRAVNDVILVGSRDAVREAVTAPPRAFERKVGLRGMLL